MITPLLHRLAAAESSGLLRNASRAGWTKRDRMKKPAVNEERDTIPSAKSRMALGGWTLGGPVKKGIAVYATVAKRSAKWIKRADCRLL